MKYYILFGPPGAGKGTQAALLVEKFNYLHISTGDLLRQEIEMGTETGLLAKRLIDNGNLVPDEVVEGMIKSQIENNPQVKGFIFDGFPRTVAQAGALDRMLADRGQSVTGVLSLMISDAMVKERIRHRAKIENRADDTSDTIIETRIKNYHAKTEPLISFYSNCGKYHEVDGDGTVDEIFGRICEMIQKQG